MADTAVLFSSGPPYLYDIPEAKGCRFRGLGGDNIRQSNPIQVVVHLPGTSLVQYQPRLTEQPKALKARRNDVPSEQTAAQD